MIKEFHLSDAESALPGTFGLVAYLLCGQVAGLIVDKRWVDPRHLLGGAVLVWSLATLLVGCSQSLAHLIALRVVVNAGESCFSAVAYPLLADFYPPAERPTAYAVVLGAIPFGCALGFGLGGILGDRFGWRAAMFMVGVPGLMLASLIPFISLPPRGVNDVGEVAPEFAAVNIKDGHGGGATGQLFIAYRAILSQTHWVMCCAAVVVQSLSMTAASEWYPTYLHRSVGISTKEAGMVMGVALVAGGCGGTLLFGRLAQQAAASYESAYFLVPALLIVPGALCLFAAVNLANTALLSCFWLSSSLFFVFSFQAPATAIMMNAVPPHLRAQSMALSALISKSFDMAGPLAIGIVSDISDLKTAMQLLWIVSLASDVFWWAGYWLLSPLPKVTAASHEGDLSLASLFSEPAKEACDERAPISRSGKQEQSYSSIA